jgi:hypothetical protein
MALNKNVGKIEQIIRIVLGIILLILAVVVGGGWGWLLGLAGIFGIITSIFSY